MTAPVALDTGTVTWRVLSTAADGPDAGTDPDQAGGGHVTFVPSSRHLPVSGATVFLTNRTHTVDAAGVLGPVTLEAGTWTAHYRDPAGVLRLSVPFTLTAGQTVDLADVVPVATVNGVQLAKGDRGPTGPPGPQGPAGAAARVGYPTLMAIGDSITANGGNFFDLSLSYAFHAHVLTKGRFVWLGNAATGGFTPEQVRDIHLPEVIAKKPTYCVVLAGQNNKTQLTAIQQTWEALLDAGITPILCTNVPTGGYGDITDVKLNQFVRHYALNHGLPLVDFNKALINPADGYFRAGLAPDGVHPSLAGTKIMGQVLADVLEKLIPTPALDVVNHDIGAEAEPEFSGHLVNNPLMLRDNGAGLPEEWGPLLDGTHSVATDPNCLGRKWTITQTNPSQVSIATWINDLPPGHRIQLSMIMGADVEATGGWWWMRFIDLSDTGYLPWTIRAGFDVPFGRALHVEFIVPPEHGSDLWRFDVGTDAAAGSSLSIAQFTLRDLTALGVA